MHFQSRGMILDLSSKDRTCDRSYHPKTLRPAGVAARTTASHLGGPTPTLDTPRWRKRLLAPACANDGPIARPQKLAGIDPPRRLAGCSFARCHGIRIVCPPRRHR